MSYGDYVEQLTYLLFLKMADERSRPPYKQPNPIPASYTWPTLTAKDGDELFDPYRHLLEKLGAEKGMLGLIFGKAQNKFQDPVKLRRVIVDLIDNENWSTMSADVKGDAYEGLLEKNAQDTKSGAGQYFWELVQSTARLCAMNLMLHGIGSEKNVPIMVADALAADPGERFDVVLTNPPPSARSRAR